MVKLSAIKAVGIRGDGFFQAPKVTFYIRNKNIFIYLVLFLLLFIFGAVLVIELKGVIYK